MKIMNNQDRRFDFLTARGFSKLSETEYESFGNWERYYGSSQLLVRIKEDRGWIALYISPAWTSPDWNHDDWFSLQVLLTYLTEGRITHIEYEFDDSTDTQLERIAQFFDEYFDRIVAIFKQDIYPAKKKDLKLIQKNSRKKFLKNFGIDDK